MEGRVCPPRRSGGPAGADRRGPAEPFRRSGRALTRAVVRAWSMARQRAARACGTGCTGQDTPSGRSFNRADRAVRHARNRMMAHTKRKRRSYGAGEWGRNRVRVFPDPKTGMYQIEWRENGRRLTRSLKQRTVGGPNHGRRSRKSNWDCTICHSCHCTGRCWTVPRKR